VLLYLSAAGIGRIGIADADVVDISNLQRQVLFTEQDVGSKKAEVAATRLSQMNSQVSFDVYVVRITSQNALDIIRSYDLVVDATDNFPTRYLLNDACVLLDKPLVYGSILEFEGQVAVFNYRTKNGSFSSNYRDLFPEPPLPDTVQNCAEAGVLGVLPGMIGTFQANEVIKILTGVGEPLADQLLIFDALAMSQLVVRIASRKARDTVKSLIDYEDFCSVSQDKNKYLSTNDNGNMKEVTVQELQKLKESGAEFQLIDVREPYEYDICNLEGELIPMSDIPNNVDKIAKDKQVIIHCRSGKRSGDMLLWLEKNHGLQNLYNLKGGILAWAREIDPEMPTY
jgi:sulfur-carrier protein adenylyltransferase/sulfurtransferase